MPQLSNFAEAQAALMPLYQNARTLYNLDTMRALMTFLDNPQNKVKTIHIAGTSGKTSTTYYVAALLKAQGLKVGHTVSPHVDNINERLQINGQPLPEIEFCALLGEFLDLVEQSGVKPSYFETFAAMAYWEFARRGLDYAVIEVGMGGEMDATNVIDAANKIAVITDIGLDHTEILGDTLAKIAWFKAGIIMPGNDTFMYEQGEDVMAVVDGMATQQHAVLHTINDEQAVVYKNLPLFQQRNLGLARAVVNFVNHRDGRTELSEAQLAEAATIVVPARLERFYVGDKTVITDGSHNQQKMQALLSSVNELYDQSDMAVLCAFVAGNAQRWQGAVDLLFTKANTVVFTTFSNQQDLPRPSITAKDFREYCDSKGYKGYLVVENPKDALQTLLEQSASLYLVTGSFFLLNHVRPWLQGQA